jgi:NitT/TauT family transport system ATP-binding protein
LGLRDLIVFPIFPTLKVALMTTQTQKTTFMKPRAVVQPIKDAGSVEFLSVSKWFGENGGMLALDNLTMSCPAEKITCILGPSGCGKSTALQMLAGFSSITSGKITVGGRPISGPGRDRVMVFQAPVLFPWLTVRQNIAFALGKAANESADRIEDILQNVGLAAFAKHYPYQLSGGMRQRAQIARALVMRPRVLLMDEPFGALDAQTRIQMQKLLLELVSKYRITTVFVTHDVDESLFLGDRIYVMTARPGRIGEQIDVPWSHPRDTSVFEDPTFGKLSAAILRSLGL